MFRETIAYKSPEIPNAWSLIADLLVVFNIYGMVVDCCCTHKVFLAIYIFNRLPRRKRSFKCTYVSYKWWDNPKWRCEIVFIRVHTLQVIIRLCSDIFIINVNVVDLGPAKVRCWMTNVYVNFKSYLGIWQKWKLLRCEKKNWKFKISLYNTKLWKFCY